jgi:hypothetical protein
VLAYAEDLKTLTPHDLDVACVRARQSSEFMPVTAAILKAHRELQDAGREEYLGPKMEWDPELERQRKERADKFQRQLASGAIKPEPEQPLKKKRTIVPSTLSIEEQKAELRRRGLL